MNNPHKAVIFDLDGTLVDIQKLFFRIINELALEFRFAPLTQEEIPSLKELHLRKFIWQRLGWRLYLFPRLLRRGREKYRALVPEVALFSGIPEIFAALRDNDYTLGILSSSEEETVQSILKRFDLSVDFIYHSALFGKARALKQALREQSLTNENALYIGDEVRDIEACRKAGVPIIAVTWGLNSKEALIKAGAETVDTREELLKRIVAR